MFKRFLCQIFSNPTNLTFVITALVCGGVNSEPLPKAPPPGKEVGKDYSVSDSSQAGRGEWMRKINPLLAALASMLMLMGCTNSFPPGNHVRDAWETDARNAEVKSFVDADIISDIPHPDRGDVMGPNVDADTISDISHSDTSEVTGPNNDFCLTNKDCPENKPYCINSGDVSKCAQCRDDNDCPKGQHCLSSGDSPQAQPFFHKCVRAKCTSDADCSPYKCDTSTGRCVPCLKDSDCPSKVMRCTSQHYCTQITCKTAGDCPDALACIGGFCQECRDMNDCPAGQTCYFDDLCKSGHSKGPCGVCGPLACNPGQRWCVGKYGYAHCLEDGTKVRRGSCGMPGGPYKCEDGRCIEDTTIKHLCDQPHCDSRECGFDQCGNLCGTCKPGQYCDGTGHCKPIDKGCLERDDPGCDGCKCENYVCKQWPKCCTEKWDRTCVVACDHLPSGQKCPQCTVNGMAGCDELQCGLDSCGAFCGGCGPGTYCHKGGCIKGIAPDIGNPCLTDGQCLAGYCMPVGKDGKNVCTSKCAADTDCPEGWQCSSKGFCRPSPDCEPSCSYSVQCGGYPDGCGGLCPHGSCPDGKRCVSGVCKDVSDGCEASEDVPGCGNCACESCVCNLKPECCLKGWTKDCEKLCVSGICDPKREMAMKCWGTTDPCEGVECGKIRINNRTVDCGGCPDNLSCLDNKCMACNPNCEGKECGSDGCGGDCTKDTIPPGVYCDDYKLWWLPQACSPFSSGGGPTCSPGKDGCFDKDCVCKAQPSCCSSVPGAWDLDCIDYAMQNCGLDCTPHRWKLDSSNQ